MDQLTSETGLLSGLGLYALQHIIACSNWQISKQEETNEFCARRNKLVGGTTLQVVCKGRQVNQGKPKLTVIGDLLHQINDRKLK